MASDSNELIVRQLYVASISAERGLADWQAYRVLADSVGVASLLPRVWYEDSLVSRDVGLIDSVDDTPQFVQSVSSDAEERNYQLSEITLSAEDQGRLVPMSSFAGTPYWSELNFLSNMAPLPFELRVGSWSRLDQAINALADRIGEVYVLSGPIYSELSDEVSPATPSAYFKVISTPESLSAFIFEAELQQHISFCDQLSTLQAVEEASGLTLYPQRQIGFADTLHASLSCDF
ncbi:MAG: hypothetical protein DHS20C12_12240 [Pseudohongiella sp.]|nr:MAG: hypothetical protein DHS20C12_12240 [Pseudohongiella sp.]